MQILRCATNFACPTCPEEQAFAVDVVSHGFHALWECLRVWHDDASSAVPALGPAVVHREVPADQSVAGKLKVNKKVLPLNASSLPEQRAGRTTGVCGLGHD